MIFVRKWHAIMNIQWIWKWKKEEIILEEYVTFLMEIRVVLVVNVGSSLLDVYTIFNKMFAKIILFKKNWMVFEIKSIW